MCWSRLYFKINGFLKTKSYRIPERKSEFFFFIFFFFFFFIFFFFSFLFFSFLFFSFLFLLFQPFPFFFSFEMAEEITYNILNEGGEGGEPGANIGFELQKVLFLFLSFFPFFNFVVSKFLCFFTSFFLCFFLCFFAFFILPFSFFVSFFLTLPFLLFKIDNFEDEGGVYERRWQWSGL